MPFPTHIAQVLDQFGIQPATKAALYDLFVSMGDEALEVFGEIAEGIDDPTKLGVDVTVPIRQRVVERYLRRNHPKWVEGSPTASLWHSRELEGRASGVARPLGTVGDRARGAVGPGQPVPDGIVVLGRNAHFGGRLETVSFDIVARDLGDALAIALAAGQQHTIPGSVGETSGTYDSRHGVALVWEVQPNVYKPSAARNRAIARIYRRHRNWHLLTLASAIDWFRGQGCVVHVLRGAALAPTHEVNPANPMSEVIVAHHDRTVDAVARSFGATLAEVTATEEFLLLESSVMNHALRRHVLRSGAASAMWRLSF